EDFSIENEYQTLRNNHALATGAICTFSGLVREFGDRPNVNGMFLEHYPGMTEQCLQKIIQQAAERWQILEARVIHRVGPLHLSEQIVFVGVSSAHRADAFAACEFIMDYLKSDAPFWKKEITKDGAEWVEAKESDLDRKKRW
ncbi:molybdenum cofactor biosynthesis protein MoaE, partial [Oleiphilus sp. HI0128]